MLHVKLSHISHPVTGKVTMKYSVSDAAKIVGITRQTIYRHITSKPISVEKDDNGNQFIEASELLRVYGNKINFEAINETADSNKNVTNTDVTINNSTSLQVLEEQLNSAKTQISMLQDQINRERSVLEEQLDTLKSALEKSQESHNQTVALLTDQTKDKDDRVGDQEKKLDELVKANEMLRKQNRRFLYELKAQQELSLWERLFGKKAKTATPNKVVNQ